MDTIQGFLSQNFVPGLLAMICLPATALLGYIVFAYVRAARRVKQLVQQPVAATAVPTGLSLLQEARTEPTYNADELPDLDILVPAKPKAAPINRAPRAIETTAQSVRLHTGSNAKAVELLTVMRDESDGRLMVLVGEKAYRTLSDAPDAKREFTRVMKELSSVIMSVDDSSSPETAVKVMPLGTDVLSFGQLLSTPPPTPPAAPKTTTAPKVAGPLPGDLPSYKFDDNPSTIRAGRAGFKKVEFTPPPTIDIPSAIEAYLQWRLSTTGMFEGRELHVINAPGGGVRIRVDNEYYDFVDDVADPEAKAFIKEAIAEWQERQG